MIARRNEATVVATAIRERLNAKYDAEEIRQSWLALTEADPISVIRIFCHIPHRADGKTDSIARPVIETYVTRLLHEKYLGTYKKVVTSLRNMFSAKPDSPTLMNFLALVRWVDPAAANRISADIGMAGPASGGRVRNPARGVLAGVLELPVGGGGRGKPKANFLCGFYKRDKAGRARGVWR